LGLNNSIIGDRSKRTQPSTEGLQEAQPDMLQEKPVIRRAAYDTERERRTSNADEKARQKHSL